MTPAFIPAWILLAPLVLIVADWLFSPKTTSLEERHRNPTFAQSPGVVTR